MNSKILILALGALYSSAKLNATSVALGDQTGNTRGSDVIDIQSKRDNNWEVASGLTSIAVGWSNESSGHSATALGVNNHSKGGESIAVGAYNIAHEYASIAIGYGNITYEADSSAVGSYNEVHGLGHAFGYYNHILSNGLINWMTYNPSGAFGAENLINTQAINSFAIGSYNNLSAANTTAFGSNITNNISGSTMVGPNNTAKVTILSSGNVGIGTSAPTSKLHVVGDLNVTGTIINPSAATTGSGSTARLRVGGTVNPSAPWQGTTIIGADGQNKVIAGYLTSSTNGAVVGAHNSALNAWADLNVAGTNLIFRSNETERMRVTNSGNVGIGTSNPQSKLTILTGGTVNTDSGSDIGQYVMIAGPNKSISSSTNSGQLGVYATDTGPQANVGGSISFGAPYNSAGNMAMNAAIKSGRNNSTNGDYSGYLSFFTRANGSIATERLRIDSR